MDKKTKQGILESFFKWYSETIDPSAEFDPNAWKVAPYKSAFIVVPSGGGYGNYMHVIKGENCIGFSPALATLESIYQKLLDLENSEGKE